MPTLSTSETINAPAEFVWALLADFANLAAWWPRDGNVQIEHVECEGEGIGMVRHIRNVGMTGRVSERLDYLDPDTMTLMLSIVGDRPAGITAYVATGTVVALDPLRCRLDYSANVATEPGRAERVEKIILATWNVMFEGLRAAASRRSA
jgi:carbon monoxide dehydrogenase subunit G